MVAAVRISFLFKAESSSTAFVWPFLFIRLSIDGHLDHFHLLAVVNKAAMNSGIQTLDANFRNC